MTKAPFQAFSQCLVQESPVRSNAAGGIIWTARYGWRLVFWHQASKLAEFAAVVLGLIAVMLLTIGFFSLRHHMAQLEPLAEAAVPGPIQLSTPGMTGNSDDRSSRNTREY